MLAAFEKVCAAKKLLTDRAAVRDAVMGTKDFDSELGRFSFDANGDTSLKTMSGSRVQNGEWKFVSLIGTD